MNKIKIIAADNKFQTTLTIVLGISLLIFYGSNIASLHTVFELGDEAGYLWNAAFFTGTDWDSFASKYPYYGYGYSILLIPLFWFASNGVWLIKGAYVVNILCVFGIYFILIKLLKEIGEKNSYGGINKSIIAFMICLMPYIATSTLKVLCEVFLTFWYCLLVLLLYFVLSKKKIIYSVFLGICGAFIFFIHTRAIVIVGVLIVTMLLIAIKRKGQFIKKFLLFLVFMGSCFGLLYAVKNNIIDYRYGRDSAEEIAEVANQNMLNFNFIYDRFRWFVDAPQNVLAVLGAKVFYVVVATGTMILPGLVCIGKQLLEGIRNIRYLEKKQMSVFLVKGFMVMTFVFMILACGLSGTGRNVREAFYGRYYEFTIPVLFGFCLDVLVNGKEKPHRRHGLLYMIFMILLGIGTWKWFRLYFTDQSVIVDTARTAAIARATAVNTDIDGVMEYLIMLSVITATLYMFNCKKTYGNWILLIIVCAFLLGNTSTCINRIHEIHDEAGADREIAEYILENVNSQKIYMIDDDSYKYSIYYSKMQIFLKDNRLYVIEPDDYQNIERDSYVLTYASTELRDSILRNFNFLKRGNVFLLYQR